MNKQLTWKQWLATVCVAIAVFFAGQATSLLKQQPPLSGAIGLNSRVATSSRLELTAGNVLTLTATSTCSTRIITTKADPILLTFTDANTPSSLYGHLQAASTTSAYQAELYGCGKWKALSADSAGTLITFTEEN